jgi:alcohol dehydrogenase class IV
MSIARFAFPTAIHFGAGARALVAAYLEAEGVRRPLIVTDRGLGALPILAQFRAALARAGLEPGVFDGVAGNPVESQVVAGLGGYRAHAADGVIGFGGGAALDVAKAIALMATHPGDLFDYAFDSATPRAIDRPVTHFIAVPTTAGTGSEVGRSSVISDDHTHVKRIIFSPRLLARAVFADPELTLGLPAPITAATGMDALTHNVESYIAKGYHPMCDGIALEGVRIASRALPVCVRAPGDLQARSDMLMAAMMGAVAFQKDLGATHSCAHALSAVADLHHGLANGVMIDYVMRFNRPACEPRLAELGRVATAAAGSDPAQSFIDWLTRLKAEIGIPARLGAVGIGAAQIAALSDAAFQDGCHSTNPRACTRADFVQLFTEAL